MITDEKKPSVYGTMLKILNYLNSPQEQNNLAGNLAAIRKTVGKKDKDTAEIWPILFPLIPLEYLGKDDLNYIEKSLLVVLQLYAIGQQGSIKVLNDESKKMSFGGSLRRIRNEKSTSLDRRFNVMLTATTFDDFTYHLRQIFKLGKTNNTFSVNFPRLAHDLFLYQIGERKQVSLNWAKEYYQYVPKEDNEEFLTMENDNQTNENKEAKK